MKIALIGYGKMGKMIEAIALERGHEVIARISLENQEDFTQENISSADVAIEFTSPHSAFENIKKLLDFNVPIVSGSTGWNEDFENAKAYTKDKNGSFLHSSNFSIGVNIFFEINKHLAKLMALQPDYNVVMKEIHHTQKKDAPSGTAVTLAEQILEVLPSKSKWTNDVSSKKEELSIISERIDPAPGTHQIKYTSVIDDIEIIHIAHNRKGFALGAVMAAEFIHNKKGVFSMQDVLSLSV